MMKEKWEQTKQFVADHKVGIAMGAVTVASVVGLVIIGKKLHDVDVPKIETWSVFKTGGDLPKPDFEVGTVVDFWQDKPDSNKMMILDSVKVGDMGKLGKQFLKIDGVTNETDISAIIGIGKDVIVDVA